MAMAARKLDNDQVRSIFESLHDQKPPPPGLSFQIVPVDSDGLRLSPPAHEYEDGIYILLRPDLSKKKKKKSVSQKQLRRPKIPTHLAHLKMETPLLKNCPWSLSGPQFPKPTAIQQRYCYPQGSNEYASTKGASLWTMYNCEGKEDDEYRLLHVYYSIKRANNMSSVSAHSKSSSIASKSKSKNKPKRKKATINIGKGQKKQKRSVSKFEGHSMLHRTLPPSSPRAMKNQIFRQPHTHISPNDTSTSSAFIHRDLSKHDSFGDSFEGHKIFAVSSNSYNDDYLSLQSHQTFQYQTYNNNFLESDHIQDLQVQSPPDLAREFDTLLGVPLADPSSMIKEQSMEWSTLADSIDTNHTSPDHHYTNDIFSEALVQKLATVYKEIIHDWICCRPHSERGQLVSVVANWARSIFQSPLDALISGEGEKERSGHVAQTDGTNVRLKMEDCDMAVAV